MIIKPNIRGVLGKIIIALTFISLFNSCRKFEEGPLFSFRSVQQRLLGEYNFSKCTIDGVDYSYYLNNDTLSTNMQFTNYWDEKKYTISTNYLNSIDYQSNIYIRSTWSFGDNRDLIILYKGSTYPNYDISIVLRPITSQNNKLIIKKLSIDEFIFEIDFQEKVYRYQMIKNLDDL